MQLREGSPQARQIRPSSFEVGPFRYDAHDFVSGHSRAPAGVGGGSAQDHVRAIGTAPSRASAHLAPPLGIGQYSAVFGEKGLGRLRGVAIEQVQGGNQLGEAGPGWVKRNWPGVFPAALR
jgi:hypothetical protein